MKTVRESYVKRLRDNYLLILRTLMHDLIVSIDTDGNFAFVNDAAVKFFGKTRKKLIGSHFSDYVHPDDLKRALGALHGLIEQKGQVSGFLLRAKSSQGYKTIAWNGLAIFDDSGNYMGAQATGKDLSDLLRVEEELKQSKQHFQSLFDVIVDPIVILDLTGKILEVSQSAEEIFGLSKAGLVGKSFLETKISNLDTKEVMLKNLNRMQQGKYISPYALESVSKDGKQVFYEVNPARIKYKGEDAILAIFRNITEQKKAEKELRASEERFRYFIENAPEAIWIQDISGTFIDGNKRAEKITGYKRDQLIGTSILDANLVPAKYSTTVMEAYEANLRGERSGPTELELIRKDGSTVFIEASSIPVQRNGQIEIIGIARDITDRKNIEEKLVASEERYRRQFEEAMDAIFLVDAKTGVIVDCNRAATTLVERTKPELIGQNTNILHPPDSSGELGRVFRQNVQQKEGKILEAPVITSNGTVKIVTIKANIIDLGDMKVVQAIFRDNTAKKKADDALKKSEERFRSTLDGMLEGCQIIGYDWKYLYLNDTAAKHGRKPKEQLIGKTILDTYPQIKDSEVFEVLTKCMKERVPAKLENEFNFFDGKKGWFELSIEPVPEGLFILSMDITDRKEVEQALRQEREMLETVTGNINAGLMVVSKDYTVLWANKVLTKYLGTIQGKPCYSALNKKKDICHGCGVKEVFETGKDWTSHEQVVSTPDGQQIWLDITVTAIKNEKGEVVAASEMSWDITERKNNEIKLKESLEKFQTVFEGATDGIVGTDPKTQKFVFANPRMGQLTGYSLEEFLNLTVFDIMPKDQMDFAVDQYQKQLKRKTNLTRNAPLLRKDNTIIFCNISSRLMKIGNTELLVGFFSDVTEQRKIEEELKYVGEKFRAISTSALDAIILIDSNGNVTFWNPAAEKIFGYTEEEVLGKEIHGLVAPKRYQETGNDMFKKFRKTGKGNLIGKIVEFVGLKKDGTEFPVELSISALKLKSEWHSVGLVRDITNRKKAEDALRESESRFRELGELLPEVVFEANLNGVLTFVNRAAFDNFGYSQEDLEKGLTVFDMLVPSDREKAMDVISKRMSGKITGNAEYTALRKDGSQFPILTHAVPIMHKNVLTGMRGIVIDITERKKVEVALRESAAKYRELINGMNDTAIVLDFNGKIIDTNKTAVEVLGYSREELLSGGPKKFDSKLTEKQITNLVESMKTNDLLVFETVHTNKKGRKFPVEVSASRVFYGGKPAILSIARDITDRKKAEEALRTSEENYRAIINAMNDTAWVIGFDEKFIDFNDAAVNALGYSKEELLSMGPKDLSKDMPPGAISKLVENMPKDGRQIFEATHFTKDGRAIPVEINSSLVNYQGKQAILSIARDITERKKAEDAIKEANVRLKRSNSELESYTYVVSHDLKAPLRTIKSFGSFILEDYSDKLDETGQDYLNRMVNASSRLDVMIEDLLVLSRVGRKFTEFEQVDLTKLLVEVLSDLEATINETKTKVIVDKLPSLFAQRVWMRQLFMNLISNALKFNESKAPKIEVLYQEKETNHLFMVRDNGIGIEAKYLERIFNLFERAPTEKKYDGTGAGLSICKKIVEHLGGKIWVESTLGKGSTFFFTLPKEMKKGSEEK